MSRHEHSVGHDPATGRWLILRRYTGTPAPIQPTWHVVATLHTEHREDAQHIVNQLNQEPS